MTEMPGATPSDPETKRLAVSYRDISNALKYVRLLENPPTMTSDTIAIREALTAAFVICYSRPFKRSNGDQAQIEPRIVLEDVASPSEPQSRLHNRILGWRDQFVAHSDAWPLCVEIDRDPAIGVVPSMHDTTLSFSGEIARECRELAEMVLSVVEGRLGSAGVTTLVRH